MAKINFVKHLTRIYGVTIFTYMKKKLCSFKFPQEFYEKLKVYAIMHSKTMTDVIIEATKKHIR